MLKHVLIFSSKHKYTYSNMFFFLCIKYFFETEIKKTAIALKKKHIISVMLIRSPFHYKMSKSILGAENLLYKVTYSVNKTTLKELTPILERGLSNRLLLIKKTTYLPILVYVKCI